MSISPPCLPRQFRRHSLSVCVAAIFALSGHRAVANMVGVLNCTDGPLPAPNGSLRAAVAAAGEGDTVEMTTTLGCSTITLSAGAITTSLDNLTILGPDSGVTITGRPARGRPEQGRIFSHYGSGTLSLEHLTIEDGNVSSPTNTQHAFGGCIESLGNVYLLHTTVKSCVANAPGSYKSYGGGIVTLGNLSTKYSTIAGNTAGSLTTSSGYGGGAWVLGTFTAISSTISGNNALAPDDFGNYGKFGGVAAYGNINVIASTISENHASNDVGGIGIVGHYGNYSATITNSTISGNTATYEAGILSTNSITVQNSTIAFNTAVAGKLFGTYTAAPGLTIIAVAANISANLQSSIFSNNTYGSTENDFSALNAPGLGKTVTISGADNLIRVSFGPVPAGITPGACPLLGPLRDNGGPTLTHALLSGSPAIDQGSSAGSLYEDQRGGSQDLPPYFYPRVSGIATDIGAYEVDQDDIIFNTGFEGCASP